MKRHFLAAIAAAACMAAPALHAQGAQQPRPADRGRMTMQNHGERHDRMMATLNLTDAQKAQIKAIHAKYEPQVKAARQAMRTQMEAARAARAKGDTAAVRANRAQMKAAMEPMSRIHQQEMAEIRAILTPEQQAKFDTMKSQRKGMMKGERHGRMDRMNHKKAPATPASQQ